MNRQRQNAITALAAAGMLWGLTVPLSKLSLAWLSPAWLTVARFVIAASLLGLMARRDLRDALTPGAAAAGAIGFGAVVMLQNAGIERTSVSHAAVMIGAAPVLVAAFAAVSGETRIGRRTWAGNVLALAGVVLVAGIGRGTTGLGDGLVFASSALSAAFVVLQPRLLAGRDAAAVTAVQLAGAAVLAFPIALATGAVPPAPRNLAPVIALASLSLLGTALPFWLFAVAQARVRAEVAGAYLNLEPVVGVAVGWLAFGDRAGFVQIVGAIIVLSGLALSSLGMNCPRALRTPRTPRSRRQSRCGTPGGQARLRPREFTTAGLGRDTSQSTWSPPAKADTSARFGATRGADRCRGSSGHRRRTTPILATVHIGCLHPAARAGVDVERLLVIRSSGLSFAFASESR